MSMKTSLILLICVNLQAAPDCDVYLESMEFYLAYKVVFTIE